MSFITSITLTSGHLLDDQDLVVTLEQSKEKSQEIYKRVGESEETEKNLNLARKRYLPVSFICHTNNYSFEVMTPYHE